ncbi:hypothetical protein [Mycobacterium malmoense]|uniref:hypothetical protein n=1 Tax=Mycobacterium malmoense TaxID=1780 RepID=UPI0008F8FBFF|nr:hypothetical protein [Mycobacterium malmoense]OIN79193.1 hypothetical protein BMG05_19295 [Mycobacterium malmoense]
MLGFAIGLFIACCAIFYAQATRANARDDGRAAGYEQARRELAKNGQPTPKAADAPKPVDLDATTSAGGKSPDYVKGFQDGVAFSRRGQLPTIKPE